MIQTTSQNITKPTKSLFDEIESYLQIIFEKENVDLEHTYIDETKIEANTNKYTWVWKKSCITNRNKIFNKLSEN